MYIVIIWRVLIFVEVVNIFYIRIYIFNEICLMYVYFLLGIDKKNCILIYCKNKINIWLYIKICCYEIMYCDLILNDILIKILLKIIKEFCYIKINWLIFIISIIEVDFFIVILIGVFEYLLKFLVC